MWFNLLLLPTKKRPDHRPSKCLYKDFSWLGFCLIFLIEAACSKELHFLHTSIIICNRSCSESSTPSTYIISNTIAHPPGAIGRDFHFSTRTTKINEGINELFYENNIYSMGLINFHFNINKDGKLFHVGRKLRIMNVCIEMI